MSDRIELNTLLASLDPLRQRLPEVREIVLANAVLFGEIPAPTFGEEARVRFLCDRFTESDLQNISVDEKGNGTAILPGEDEEAGNILISAHVDTNVPDSVDHTITVDADSLNGPGIADNSLGLAVMASLPAVLAKMDIRLKHNLVLLGATRSLGKGDLEGLRFFVEHTPLDLSAAVCVEGVHLGRLSYASLGMLRGEITCRTTETGIWASHSRGSITELSKIIQRLMALPLPQDPKTTILLGSFNAGRGYHRPPSEAVLRFEVRSEQAGMVAQILEKIEEIVDETDAERAIEARLEVVARRRPGGITFGHPLVKATKAVMEELQIEPKIAPSVGDLSAVINEGIPGVTLGLTTGHRELYEEKVTIEPLYQGLAQLIGVLQAIDEGLCDERND